MQRPDHEAPRRDSPAAEPESEFHLWRLLGAIGIVILLLAGAAALVDIVVLG